ncbi:MAG: AAA family ATPase [Acidobacteria bacterium]|nr:AAA family ATPase [Acidobacteriota bacterium]
MELIREKITAPPIHPAVARRRLLNQFAELLPGGGVTVITGRAGMGKTTLATAFAQRCGRRVAWYKADAPDAELSVFLQYLVASVALPQQGWGWQTLTPLKGLTETHNASALAEAFAYSLQQQKNSLLLVLDDLHLLYDTPWLKPFLHRLMTLLPEEAHLLIAARSLPPAPLWRLRSKQRLRVIDEAALLFTVPETEELFVSYGLSVESVKDAWRCTSGRAAALDGLARKASLASVVA